MIAGSRTFNDYTKAEKIISDYLRKNYFGKEIVVVSGGCRGADKIGERYAGEKGLKKVIFGAEWGKYGRAAGPIRNEKMAKVADCVICFWDGKSAGTKSMINLAKKYNKPVYINIV